MSFDNDLFNHTYCPKSYFDGENINDEVISASHEEACPDCDNRNICYFSTCNAIRDKGLEGERLAYESISTKFNTENSSLLTDLYVPKSNNDYSQIDLLFIHPTGIYIIESKNWDGKLYGNYDSLYLQVHNYFIEEYYNPILQNNVHIETLKNFMIENNIDISTINFYSVIALSDESNYDNITNVPENIILSKYNYLGTKLCEFIATNSIYNDLIDSERLKSITELLLPCTEVSDGVKYRHFLNIEKLKGNNLFNPFY